MFMSVDLPAPFSPRSACTSPRRRSKSTRSFARTPGKRFVMPRSSRTGVSGSATVGGDSTERRRGRAREPALFAVRRFLLDRGRRLDRAGDDLRAERGDLLEERGRDVRADLAHAHAAVLQVERQVATAVELAALRTLDGEIDARVDALHGARQDVLAEVGLVDVDADAPDPRLLRSVQRAEAARPRDVELDLRALVDLVLRDRLALRLVDEVLRVALEHRDARVARLRAGLVAREEAVDRRDLDAADDADRLLAALLLHHQAGEAPDEVRVLLRRIGQALDVLDEGVALLVRERRDVGRVVGDRELRVRELLRDRRLLVGEKEARADDDVDALARQRREVRQVLTGRVRLERGRRQARNVRLRVVQALELQLVETLVVEATDV